MTTSSYSTAFQGPGETINVTCPYARLGGQGLLVGSLFGVAARDLALSEVGPMELEGAYYLAKTSAQAYTVGQRLSWDDTNKRLDSNLALGPVVATATAIAANPSSFAHVVLFGAAANGGVVPQGAVADLGAFTAPIAGAVTVTSNAATDLSGIVAPAVATLTLKVNAILVALRAAGILAP